MTMSDNDNSLDRAALAREAENLDPVLFPPGTLFPRESGWFGDLADAPPMAGTVFHWPAWVFGYPGDPAIQKAAGAVLEPVLRELMGRARALPEDEQAAALALESAIIDIWTWAREQAVIDTLNRPRRQWHIIMRSTEKQQDLANRIDRFLASGIRPKDWDNWRKILKGIRQHLPPDVPPGQYATTGRLLESLYPLLQRHLKKDKPSNGDLQAVLRAVLPDDTLSTKRFIAELNRAGQGKKNDGAHY